MKFEKVLTHLKEGDKVFNESWGGLHNKIMWVRIQNPDEHSMNTEPYFIMETIETETKKEPMFRIASEKKVAPWMPSILDFFSDKWKILKFPDEMLEEFEVGDVVLK